MTLETRFFTSKELATVLAALRYFQMQLLSDKDAVAEMSHFGDVDPLTSDEINVLCERLNFGEANGVCRDRAEELFRLCLEAQDEYWDARKFKTEDGYVLEERLPFKPFERIWTDGDMVFASGADGLPVDDTGTSLSGDLVVEAAE